MAIAVSYPLLTPTRRSLLIGLGATGSVAAAEAIAALHIAEPIRVTVNDTGINKISAALELAAASQHPPIIAIEPGVYREKLRIDVANVTLMATAPGVVITYDAAAGLARPNGGKWGTGGSATMTIDAAGVTLRGLTIRNDFDYLADMTTHASGGAQAVALAVGRGADRALIDRCTVEGYQDTLYVAARSMFRRCRIAGGVDFIFGGAAALFSNCDIITRYVPGAPEQGYIAAPSTLASDRFGLVFDCCRVGREAGVPDRSTYLGRPWRAGGNMAILGAATFRRCHLDGHIKAEGWSAMGFTDPAGMRRTLEPGEARLFEWQSRGPGAGPPRPGRRQLADGEASAFTPTMILQGWVP